MSQARSLSLLEALANVAVGYGVALVMQLLLFPVIGIAARPRQMLLAGLGFMGVSLLRSYLLRRLFDRLQKERR